MTHPAPYPGHLSSLDELSLTDVESVRLILRGASVIDWHRLAFRNYEDVDRFLRVNEFDPENDSDIMRLEDMREEAVEYLTRNFGYRIPAEVGEELPARDLFLLASQRGRRQTYACTVLKVMHIIQHLAGRELITKLPISDDNFFHFVEAKVVRVIEEIRGAGYPIVEFAWSRKERDSLITKLLAKKQTLAAHVYDKLRFRLITRRQEDLIPILAELTRRLIPFNYVVPGESVNDLISIQRLVDTLPADELVDLQPEPADTDPPLPSPPERAPMADPRLTQPINEFSAASYRIVNFVADMPVKIESIPGHRDNQLYDELGPIVYVLTEFQIVDAQTAHTNDFGDANHQAYKERQKARVKTRLTCGAMGPRDE